MEFEVWLSWRELDGSEGLGKQTGACFKLLKAFKTYDECLPFMRGNWPRNRYQDLSIINRRVGRQMSYVL